MRAVISRDLPFRRNSAAIAGASRSARPAQPQPRGLQPKHIVSGDIGKHVRSGSAGRTSGPQTTKGIRRPHPLRKPAGLPDGLERSFVFRFSGWSSRPSAGAWRRGGSRHAPPLIPPRCGATTDTYWRVDFCSKATTPGGGGEQRMVDADADVAAGMKFRAALANEDVAAESPARRRTSSRRGGGRRNRARCATNRLLSYEPLIPLQMVQRRTAARRDLTPI